MDAIEVKEITDQVKNNCIIGVRKFEPSIQQFTCKFINGDDCSCHKEYLEAIRKEKAKR